MSKNSYCYTKEEVANCFGNEIKEFDRVGWALNLETMEYSICVIIEIHDGYYYFVALGNGVEYMSIEDVSNDAFLSSEYGSCDLTIEELNLRSGDGLTGLQGDYFE